MVLRVAIIGGGAAGMAAASRVKRLLGDRADVTVFERGRWVSFALCGTPYYVGCTVRTLHDLVHYPLEEFTRRRRINVNLETEVFDVNDDSRTIRWRRGSNVGVYEYDYLVIATGAQPVVPSEWLNYDNVFTLHSLEDADKLRTYISRNRVETVAIIGAGYIGVELAESFTSMGKHVILFEAFNQVLPRMLDADVAQYVHQELDRHGVTLRLGEKVKRVEGEGRRARVVVTERGDSVEADIFIAVMGVRPNVELAKTIGLRIGVTGAIWVDETMRTSRSEIYAVGDAAETIDLVTGDRIWYPLAPIANKMGYVAGSNIAGRRARFPGIVRTSVTAFYDTFIAATGLTESEARRRGYDVVSAKLEAESKPRYMPQRGKIVLKIVADRRTGRILGAQAVGDVSAYWRVNVVSALLYRRGTIWDLFYGDWGYMPKVSPVWDPLVVAGRLLMRELGEEPHSG
jgi:NADPH-dependent 2,4-dienoyl-CoA reductase/sulfur reductase-like enzyme